MAGESQQPPNSVPDPTVLTTEALTRGLTGERGWTEGQLGVLRAVIDGMEKAAALRALTVASLPDLMDQKVKHLGDLTSERFASVANQFQERDRRGIRESSDNKIAVDAAFAAQKEAAAKQNESNTLAIAKSETATKETIDKLTELMTTMTSATSGQIDDIKVVMALLMPRAEATSSTAGLGQRMESAAVAINQRLDELDRRVTVNEARSVGQQAQSARIVMAVAFVSSIIGIVAAAAAALGR